jgi:MYXO-CTERM domain-containing protein
MIRRLLLPLAFVSVLAADASASVVRCWGQMREANCNPTTRAWPASSQPTFGVACEGCGLTPDGGGLCRPLELQPINLRITVGGQTFGAEHFEIARECGEERLFRYKGPLQPGQRHEIIYPGNVDYSQPRPYTVTFEVAPGPFPPTGSPPPDAGPTDDGGAGAASDAGGCSTAGRPHFPWAMAIAGLALMVRRRRRR